MAKVRHVTIDTTAKVHEVTIKVEITSDHLKVLKVLDRPGSERAAGVARQSGVDIEDVEGILKYLIHNHLAYTITYGVGETVYYTIAEQGKDALKQLEPVAELRN
jgi:hypothetical protein